ncbi:hypothetical protein [Nannocystis pusilla]|uniref:hypothetical protein n=1 Tax=Nannocystis pusilla TaxID=889268 RepID=UPI003B7F3DFA
MQSMDFDALRDRVFAHPDNAAVLAWLEAEPSVQLKRGTDGYGYDEGATVFFWEWGRSVPEDAKFDLSYHHLMIHPVTARIFAFQHGRFTFVLRRDWARAGEVPEEDARVGYTLDASVDFSELGDPWCLLNGRVGEGDEGDELLWAWELAGRDP